MSSDNTAGIGGIRIGTELNQTYMIDSLIGVGGMGEVFRGHNIQTGDPVAIKIVLPEFSKDEMILELFRKEARILNHLAHDAIVRYHVFTIDRSIGRPYLAMEYADGPSLAEKLKSGPLSEDDVALLQTRLADGLQKAHEAGVIHRDMSPDNVILPDGQVKSAKIIDFGIARSANVGGGTLLGGSFAGKYNYVSPEQLGLHGGEVTPKSDIYSLALVLAAALRGAPLEMSGSQVEVIEKRRVVPDLAGISPRFRDLLAAMLHPDPAQRPQSMAAVRDWKPTPAGKAVSTDDATVIRRTGAAVKIIAEDPAESPVPPVVAEIALPAQSAKGNYLAIGGALLAVIVLGVLGGLYFLDQGTRQQDANQDTVQPPAPETTKAEVPKPPPVAQASPPGLAAAPNPVTVFPATAILDHLAKRFASDSCFHVLDSDVSATSAKLSVLSDQNETSFTFDSMFLSEAGFSPMIVTNIISENQCAVAKTMGQLTSPNALRLKLVMANEGGEAAVVKNGKTWLEASVSSIGPRNVTVLLVTDDGAVQNISRLCVKCLSLAGDTLMVRLPLAKPPGSSTLAAKQPVLLLAIASPRNLFSVSSQSQYRLDTLIPELVKDIAGATDVSTAVGYFRF